MTELVVKALTDKADVINTAQLSQLADLLPRLIDKREKDKTAALWEEKSVFRYKMKLRVLTPLFRLVTDGRHSLECALDELQL